MPWDTQTRRTDPRQSGWSGWTAPPQKKKPDSGELVDQALGEARGEAERLTGEEESRGSQMIDILRNAIAKAGTPTLSQRDIDMEFGRDSDAANQDFLSGIHNVRSMLGASGMTGQGSWAAGLGKALKANQLTSLIGSRRDLMLKKSTSDAFDRMKQLEGEEKLAEAVNRPVSMINSDFMQMLTGIRLSQQQGYLARGAAKDAADAQKESGMLSGIGGLLGGALTAFA